MDGSLSGEIFSANVRASIVAERGEGAFKWRVLQTAIFVFYYSCVKHGGVIPSYAHLRASALRFAKSWAFRKAPGFYMSGRPTRLKGFLYDVVWSGQPPTPARPYRGSLQMEQAVEAHLKERLEMGDLVQGRGR